MINDGAIYPLSTEQKRLANYAHYEMLFAGEHFNAWKMRINSPLYAEQYARLKYVTINFAGLISRVSADMLFGEGIAIKGSSKQQSVWLNNLAFENKLGTQLYESALINSRLGDDLLKIRSGARHARQTSNVSTVIIEETRPDIYYPHFAMGNWRAEPEYQDLAFKVSLPGDKKEYLRVERHYPGFIENKFFEIQKDGKLIAKQNLLKSYMPGLAESQETGIDRSLVIHVPNYRTGSFWGVSDYADIESLMYAVNNRMTKNENVLDKHTDPILALPEGLLDKDGKVDKAKLEVFTIPDNDVGGTPAKPEYITWNASLENSFKQVEKLVEFLYMTSETSPNVFGMGKDGGQAESGRALKLKLIRTLAKINRKKIFYDQGVKEALLVSQMLAQKHGYQVLGSTLPGAPEVPDILWRDGLPIDEIEQVELESKKLDAGIQSKRDAIIRIDDLDEEEALEKVERIRQETTIAVPSGLQVSGDGDDDEV